MHEGLGNRHRSLMTNYKWLLIAHDLSTLQLQKSPHLVLERRQSIVHIRFKCPTVTKVWPMAVPPKSYKAVAAIAQKRRDANLSSFYQLPPINVSSLPNDLTLFPRQSGLLSPGEVEIVESQAEDILEKLANRVWSAVDVTQAFCKSASIAQKLASCSISRGKFKSWHSLDQLCHRSPVRRSSRKSKISWWVHWARGRNHWPPPRPSHLFEGLLRDASTPVFGGYGCFCKRTIAYRVSHCCCSETARCCLLRENECPYSNDDGWDRQQCLGGDHQPSP